MQYLLGCLIALAALLVAGDTEARWRDMDFGLTAEDIEIVKQKARIEMTGQPEGTVLKWRNKASGTYGAVILEKRHFREGRECRDLRHDVVVEGTQRRQLRVTICQQNEGHWMMEWR